MVGNEPHFSNLFSVLTSHRQACESAAARQEPEDKLAGKDRETVCFFLQRLPCRNFGGSLPVVVNCFRETQKEATPLCGASYSMRPLKRARSSGCTMGTWNQLGWTCGGQKMSGPHWEKKTREVLGPGWHLVLLGPWGRGYRGIPHRSRITCPILSRNPNLSRKPQKLRKTAGY